MGQTRDKLKVIKNKDVRSYVHIEGDEDGSGPFEVSYQGVSPQLILVLESFITEWKEELLEMVQYGAQEEGQPQIDFEPDDND